MNRIFGFRLQGLVSDSEAQLMLDKMASKISDHGCQKSSSQGTNSTFGLGYVGNGAEIVEPYESGNNIYGFLGSTAKYDGSYITIDDKDQNAFLGDKWESDTYSFLEKLEGGVCGLRFDRELDNLILFRDRFGSKPIYYTQTDSGFFFANEIKLLLPILPGKTINYSMVKKYFSMNYRMWWGRKDTFFKDIKELGLSSFLVISDRELQTSRYWAPSDEVMIGGCPDDYIDRYNKLLERSVTYALNQSDKPLFLVSGGLDSPVIASKASQVMGEKVDCLAAVFPSFPNHDESSWIKILTDKIGEKVFLHNTDPDTFLESFDRCLERHDQPLLSPTYVLFYQLIRFAEESGYKQVFGGGGGDIVSQGCLEYQLYILADYLHHGSDVFIEQVNAWCDRMKGYLRYWPADNVSQVISKISQLVDMEQPGVVFNNPDWVVPYSSVQGPLLNDMHVDIPTIHYRYHTYRASRMVEELMHQAIAGHFVEDINISTFDIQGKDPFWDLDFVEFGLKLPVNMVTRDGWIKYIVRQATKGYLPDEIRLRVDKTGLGVPIGEWMKAPSFSHSIMESFEREARRNTGIINHNFISQAYKEHMSGLRDHTSTLWSVWSYLRWYERWVEG